VIERATCGTRRAGGGDKGMRATTLVRSPGVNEGTSSVVREGIPEDVDGRVRPRGGCGSPGRELRDCEDRERRPARER